MQFLYEENQKTSQDQITDDLVEMILNSKKLTDIIKRQNKQITLLRKIIDFQQETINHLSKNTDNNTMLPGEIIN